VARLVVVDANLNWQLAACLVRRGREAVALKDLNPQKPDDPFVLRMLANLYANQEWLFLTADDALPGEHAGIVAHLSITVATVDGDRPRGDAEEKFLWESVHRWAHYMIEKQALATVVRYSHKSTASGARGSGDLGGACKTRSHGHFADTAATIRSNALLTGLCVASRPVGGVLSWPISLPAEISGNHFRAGLLPHR
jgi:hypothetical protein